MVRSGVGLVLMFAATLASAQGLTKLKMTLDWRFEGQLAMFLLAKNRGYFEKEGLDVAVDSGVGSTAAINRIASGSHDFGHGDIMALAEFMGNNPGPVRMQAVYQVYNESPFVIMTRKNGPIKHPRDLAGKKVAAPVFDSIRKTTPVWAKFFGFDAKSVNYLTVEPALREVLVVRGDADACTGFETNKFVLFARGLKEEDAHIIKLSELGFKLYGNAVIVSKKLIDENPKAVAGIVRAINRAILDSMKNPAEAIKANKEFDALIDEKNELQKLLLTFNYIDTEATKKIGIGAVDRAELARQVEEVSAAFGVKSQPNVDLLFNSSFLPPQAERMVR